MQGLNSTREFSTKNYYFSMHILFSIIYLLQGKELNPKIYSKQELIMELFYKLLAMVYTCMQKFRAL
jgi:hypothetical protein